ncbi:hypothetical protein DENSPDRAFT_10651 [Dentipellis sp. KUC8613]|nr:hypothetical protein DENSPDRAFT_10651 [Dentipellis sp. KUC8613]
MMVHDILTEDGSTPQLIVSLVCRSWPATPPPSKGQLLVAQNMFKMTSSSGIGFGDQHGLREYSYDHFVFAIPDSYGTAAGPKALPPLIHPPTEGAVVVGARDGCGQTSNHPESDTTSGRACFTFPLSVQAAMSTSLTSSFKASQPTELTIQEGVSAATGAYSGGPHMKQYKTQAIDLGDQHPLGPSTNGCLQSPLRGPGIRSRTAGPRGAKGQHKDKSRRPRSKIPLAPIHATRFVRHACPHTDSKKTRSRTKDARQYKWVCRLCRKKSERRDLALYESWESAKMVFLFCGGNVNAPENGGSA